MPSSTPKLTSKDMHANLKNPFAELDGLIFQAAEHIARFFKGEMVNTASRIITEKRNQMH